MKLNPFVSLKSTPRYEKAATQAPDPRSPKRATFAPDLDSSHGYAAPLQTRRNDAFVSSSLLRWTERGRWTQLGLRSVQLCAALGLLICVFCLKNLQVEQSYTLRVPAFVDVLTTFYTLYSLSRKSPHLRPSTTASYHFFAFVLDAGLIPFYVFIALLPRGTPGTDNINKTLWTSVVVSTGSQNKVRTATWILAITTGAVHVIGLLISSVLFFTFCHLHRAQAQEARLTARPRHKHSLALPPRSNPDDDNFGLSEKVHQPSLSFLQTRIHGDTRYSPHNPTSAAFISPSRLNLSLPSLPLGTRSLRGTRNPLDLFKGAHNASLQSFSGSSFYSDEEGAPPLPRKSSKRKSDQPGDIEYADHEPSSTADEHTPHSVDIARNHPLPVPRATPSISAFDFAIPALGHKAATYQALPQNSFSSTTAKPVMPTALPKSSKRQKFNGAGLQPLHMNPPTPPPGATFAAPRAQPLGETVGVRVGDAGVKSRFYGDLGLAQEADVFATTTVGEGSGRVVSASGSDIADAGMPTYDLTEGTSYGGAGGVVVTGLRGRGRVASGGAAEEGRASAEVGQDVVGGDEGTPSKSRRGRWAGLRGVW